MLQAIGAVLQLIILIFSKWFEFDKEKKDKKAKLQKELENAIGAKDSSAIVAVLDDINRMR